MESRVMDKNTFWIKNPRILFQKDQILDIIPTNDMTKAQKQNAITRFCLYGSILLYLNKSNEQLMYLMLFIIVSLIIFNFNDISQEVKPINKRIPEYSLDKKLNNGETVKIETFNGKRKRSIKLVDDLDNGIQEDFEAKINERGNIVEQEGNTALVNGKKNSETCQAPTKHNPFMNVLLTDYVDNPKRPGACSLADVDVERSAEDYFNENLFKDIDEVYGSVHSQRQFISNPSTTIPNPQKEFAEWLYKMPPTCKEGDNCYKYEDLRQFRNNNT